MKKAARRLVEELRLCRLLLRDPRTPWLARILLGCAVAYAASPIDLIPDLVPVLGHLDDAVIVPSLVVLALALVPKAVVREHRLAVRGRSAGRREVAPIDLAQRVGGFLGEGDGRGRWPGAGTGDVRASTMPRRG